MPDEQKHIFPKTRVADTFWKRLFGLMGRKSMGSEEALLFKRTKSVHTCFMSFPIDLIWFDKKRRIVKISESIEPWNITFCWKARGVLEVFGGEAKRKGVEVGKQLFHR